MKNIRKNTSMTGIFFIASIVLIHLFLVRYSFAQSSRLFFDDFESGNLSKWTECGSSITSSKVHGGTKALVTDLTKFGPCYVINRGATGLETYVSFWSNFGTTIATDYNHFWRLQNPPTYTHQMDCDWSHNINGFGCAWLGNGIDKGYRDGRLYTNDNTWHRTEVYVKLNTPGQSNGIFKYWLDGSLVFNATAANLRGNSNITLTQLTAVSNFSAPPPAGVYFMYTDDVEWWNGCPPSGASCSSLTNPSPPAAPMGLSVQ